MPEAFVGRTGPEIDQPLEKIIAAQQRQAANKGWTRPDDQDYMMSPMPDWKDVVPGTLIVLPLFGMMMLEEYVIRPLRERLFGPRT